MKLIISLIIFSVFFSCKHENNDIQVKSEFIENNKEEQDSSSITYNPNFHNLLVSNTIDTSILRPGKASIYKVESIIGIGEKEQWNMNLGEDGGCFPYNSVYDNLGLEFFYMMYYNDSITTITVFKNNSVQLKSGITINSSSKNDVLKIYGENYHDFPGINYPQMEFFELGITFTLFNDTVSRIKIYTP